MGMISERQNEPAVTTSAEQLVDAAAILRRDVLEFDAIAALPATLAHIADAVDELAGSVVVLAERVAKSPGGLGRTLALDHLPLDERALCWHLHEFAARLRAARASAESPREWAPSPAAQELAGVPFT
jgi:hypothetical protein